MSLVYAKTPAARAANDIYFSSYPAAALDQESGRAKA
jgi:hypothetical protein